MNRAGPTQIQCHAHGTSVLTAFYIFAAAGGANKAISEQFTATANTAGQIIVGFTQAGADNPQINALNVLH